MPRSERRHGTHRASAAVRPRSPDSMAARRTTAIGMSAAVATASVITPASAPMKNNSVAGVSVARIRAAKARQRKFSQSEFSSLVRGAPWCSLPAEGWFSANNLIVSNCVCEVLPVYGRVDPGITLNGDDLNALYEAAGGTAMFVHADVSHRWSAPSKEFWNPTGSNCPILLRNCVSGHT